MAETKQAETEEKTENEQAAATQAQSAEFADVPETSGQAGQANLDILLDISMPITINIGKTEIPFRKVLQLGPDAVLQLDKPVEQPADLYIRDIKFATGDIVVVDGCFAVRIKDIVGMEKPIPSDETKQKEKSTDSE